MRTNQIYIARDGKSGMHVLVRILAVDDIGKDYLPIDPDDFNKLMMARDVRSLVLAARDLGPMYISADILSHRIFVPSHLRQHIEHGVNLVPSDLESLLSECYFDPYALPVETDSKQVVPEIALIIVELQKRPHLLSRFPLAASSPFRARIPRVPCEGLPDLCFDRPESRLPSCVPI